MRADRLLRMLMLLQRHRRVTAAWLADELEVSERTVLRDMQALSAAGVPVYTEQGHGGGCVLMEEFTTRASGLTPAETQALFSWAGRESNAQLGLGTELTSALAKVAATAPSAALADAEALGEVVLTDRRRWFAADDAVPWLPELRRAVSTRRRVRVRYRGAQDSDARIRTLHPYGLVDHSGRWYLVADHRGRRRTYRVSRLLDVDILDQPAVLSDDRPLAQVWAEVRQGLESQQSATEAVVTVHRDETGPMRRLLSMQLAAGTSIGTEEIDGSDRERWRLRLRDPEILAAMAVMQAPAIEVEQPRWLRGRVRAAALRTLDLYPEEGTSETAAQPGSG